MDPLFSRADTARGEKTRLFVAEVKFIGVEVLHPTADFLFVIS